MLRSLRARLPSIGRWPRLLLAGTCLLLALSTALGAKHGSDTAPARTVPVVVAARALPVGHTVVRRDLAVARWPAKLRPAGARADPAGLLGARLANPLAAGDPVTPRRLAGAGLADDLPAGLVAAAISLDDAHAADLARAGDHVDVLGAPRPPALGDPAPPGRSRVSTVAKHALVLAVLPAIDQAAAEVILALTRDAVVAVTTHRSDEMLILILDPP